LTEYRTSEADDAAPSPYGSNSMDSVGALRQSAATSAKWGFISTAGGLGGRLLFTFALARWIGPDSFGIAAQAMIYLTLILLLVDQGFGAALVQRKQVDRLDVGSVTVLNLGLAAALVLATFALSPAVSDFFGTPELRAVLQVLCVSVVVKAMAVAPMALARRKLRYRAIAMVQIVSVCVGGTFGIVGAVSGAGYWALVIQTVLADTVMLAGLLLIEGPPVLRMSTERLRAMWAFSLGLLGARMLGFVRTNADNVLIGWREPAAELAFYGLAYRLLRMPIQMFGSVVNDVALPIYSRLQDDVTRMRSWFLISSQVLALVTFPFMTYLILVSPAAIPAAFGDRWAPAVLPLQLLAVAGYFAICQGAWSPLCTAIGRTDAVFRWGLILVVVTVIGFGIGIWWGINGVALSYACTQAIMLVPIVHALGKLVDLSVKQYFSTLLAPSGACVALAAAYVAVEALLEGEGFHALGSAGVATVLSAIAYIAALRVLWPSTFETALTVLRSMGKESIQPDLG